MSKLLKLTSLAILGLFLVVGCGDDDENTAADSAVKYVVFGQSIAPAANLADDEALFNVADIKLSEVIRHEFEATNDLGEKIAKKDNQGNQVDPFEPVIETNDELTRDDDLYFVDFSGLDINNPDHAEEIVRRTQQVYQISNQVIQSDEANDKLYQEFGHKVIKYDGKDLSVFETTFQFKTTTGQYVSFAVLTTEVRRRSESEAQAIADLQTAEAQEAQAQEAVANAQEAQASAQEVLDGLAAGTPEAQEAQAALDEATQEVQAAQDELTEIQDSVVDLQDAAEKAIKLAETVETSDLDAIDKTGPQIAAEKVAAEAKAKEEAAAAAAEAKAKEEAAKKAAEAKAKEEAAKKAAMEAKAKEEAAKKAAEAKAKKEAAKKAAMEAKAKEEAAKKAAMEAKAKKEAAKKAAEAKAKEEAAKKAAEAKAKEEAAKKAAMEAKAKEEAAKKAAEAKAKEEAAKKAAEAKAKEEAAKKAAEAKAKEEAAKKAAEEAEAEKEGEDEPAEEDPAA